ncbi:sensor histidine kinase [uncultured Robinsoniella sp.]|uniref:cache domain-containing sensor histidine kinase n=1 Tax=uncultured Robinsoniella sp. TaxID=904190 RepID=UPI00374EDDB0
MKILIFPSKKNFRNLPVQSKMLLSLLLSILVTGLVMITVLTAIRYQLHKQVTLMTSKTLNLYQEMMELQITDLKDYSVTLMTSPDVQKNLKIINSVSNDPFTRLSCEEHIRDYLFNSCTYSKSIEKIEVFSIKNAVYSSASSPFGHSFSSMEDLPREVSTESGGAVWLQSRTKDNLIGCARLIRSTSRKDNFDTLGAIIIWIDMDKLTDNTSFNENYYKSFIYIKDSDTLLYQPSDELDPALIASLSDDSIQKLQGQSYIVSQRQSPITNWNYYLLISQTQVMQGIDTAVQVAIIILVIVFLLVLVSCIRISRMITIPLSRMNEEMHSLAHGNFQIREEYLLESVGEDEIGAICHNFINTTKQIDTLINENYKTQLLTKEAQLQALQAQIDPHFLYNALDCVNWIAKVNGQPQISTIVQSLAILMRSAMTQKQNFHTIQDEITLINHYIAIQQIRFGKRLIYETKIDETILSIEMPKLMIQPIIENSIKYGLEPSDHPCTITLVVQQSGEQLQILVKDNGPGFPETQIPLILNGTAVTNGNGVGLKNVNERIKLFYGADYHLIIQSTRNTETAVGFPIPLVHPFAETNN